jgi:hypothetical protein
MRNLLRSINVNYLDGIEGLRRFLSGFLSSLLYKQHDTQQSLSVGAHKCAILKERYLLKLQCPHQPLTQQAQKTGA